MARDQYDLMLTGSFDLDHYISSLDKWLLPIIINFIRKKSLVDVQRHNNHTTIIVYKNYGKIEVPYFLFLNFFPILSKNN